MKILPVSVLNPYSQNNNVSFDGARIPKRVIKKASDETLKNVQRAIAATGIASLMLGKSNEDYINSIAVPIERAKLSKEDMEALSEGFKIAPVLMDLMLTTTSKNVNNQEYARGISKKYIDLMIDTYSTNPDLTEKLIVEKDDKGILKYTYEQISLIVKANEVDSELLEYAKDEPHLVNSILSKLDNNGHPSYGIEDVELYFETMKKDNKLANRMLDQHDIKGNPRFTGIEALLVLENMDDDFMKTLFKAENYGGLRSNSIHRFNGEQICDIYDACKSDEKKKDFIKKLLEPNLKALDWNLFLTHEEIRDIACLDIRELAENYAMENRIFKFRQILALRKEEVSIDEFEKIAALEDKDGEALYRLSDLEKIKPLKNTIFYSNYPEFRAWKTVEQNKLAVYDLKYPELVNSVFKEHLTNIDFWRHSFKFENQHILGILSKAEKNPELMSELIKYIDKTKIDMISATNKKVSSVVYNALIRCFDLAQQVDKDKLDSILHSSKTKDYWGEPTTVFGLEKLKNKLNYYAKKN